VASGFFGIGEDVGDLRRHLSRAMQAVPTETEKGEGEETAVGQKATGRHQPETKKEPEFDS
jgi:hypothetical protein